MNTRGVANRDLKLENLMIDENFDLNMVDFGFACSIQGRQGDGLNRETLGTDGYMAPEVHMKTGYQGQVVDLFALGVSLFILYAGFKPFETATFDDPHYKLLAQYKSQQFWQAHEQGMPRGFFSQSFKDLITVMLSFQPYQRLTMADLVAHPWF